MKPAPPSFAAVDDLRFGAAIRAARIRRRWRQDEVGTRAGVSGSTVSRIERGHLAGIQLVTIRAVAEALDVRVELLPRSRGGDLDRLVNARHAAMTEAFVGWLRAYDGWEVRVEHSFSHFGERGVLDVVGWHEDRRALLEVELKTDVVDSGELLATTDRRRRLGTSIVEPLGWVPSSISSLVIGDSDANRWKVEKLRHTFETALPDRIVAIRSYLRAPDRAIRGLMFFAIRQPGQPNGQFATACRVRGPAKRARAA